MAKRILIAFAVPVLVVGLGLSLPWARAGQKSHGTAKHRVVFHVEEGWSYVKLSY